MDAGKRRTDRQATIPLLTMNNPNSSPDGHHDHDGHGDPSWSDQELDEYVQDPLEGVLRSVLQRPRAISRQQCVVSAVFISSVSLAFGFLTAYALFFYLFPPLCGTPAGPPRADLTRRLLLGVEADSIRRYLRNLTYKPHIAGSDQNYHIAEYLRDTWASNGLSNVRLVPYNVLLSNVERDTPNTIQVVEQSTGEVIINMVGIQPALYAPEENDTTATPSFNAYSTPGRVMGDLVYVNFAHVKDFEWLKQQGINLKGKIAIARYGSSFRANKVKFAEQYGAAGLIIFSDPHEYAVEGRDKVYPNAFWLPGTGTQSGTAYLGNGDPETPRYPSVESAYRMPGENNLMMPTIPVQPIGYDDAERLLSLMTGPVPPKEWIGDLNVAYRVGPGFANESLSVVMDIKTQNNNKTIYNVIGVIPGIEEPDRYVVLGNHHDAWIFGGLDPCTGTAALTEVTRVFGELLKTGWRPRRTIVFCSWDAEEYGLIGSAEWVEDNAKLLGERAVAYLNIDTAVTGNFTLFARASPLLFEVMFETAKKIPNPNPDEVAKGRTTVYDTWLYVTQGSHPHLDAKKPRISMPGSGSDYAHFLYFTGVPVSDHTYSPDKRLYRAGNPLYHSLYETFYAADTLVDPGFNYHVAVTQFWAEMARALADSALLPLSVPSYAEEMLLAFKSFSAKYGKLLKDKEIELNFFQSAVTNFSIAAEAFNASLQFKIASPMKLRMLNDQMIQVERAFIQPEGLPLSPTFKHVILSPSTFDTYASEYFAGLVDILYQIGRTGDPKLWTLFEQQLAAVTYYIQSAADVLKDTTKL